MSDEKKLVLLEKVGQDGKIIKIKFNKEVTPNYSTAYIAAAFEKCFKNDFNQIIIDMEHIPFLSNNFIATLIEATAKVRRKNGDVKIINLTEEAKQTMSAFNAYSFLSIKAIE